MTNTQSNNDEPSDFHEQLMLYGKLCSEDGYLSEKAVTMRMDIAVLYRDLEQLTNPQAGEGSEV